MEKQKWERMGTVQVAQENKSVNFQFQESTKRVTLEKTTYFCSVTRQIFNLSRLPSSRQINKTKSVL